MEHDGREADRLVVRTTRLLRGCEGDPPVGGGRHELEPGGPEVSGAGESAECEHQLRPGASGRIQRALRRIQRSVGDAGFGRASAAAVPAVYRRQPV